MPFRGAATSTDGTNLWVTGATGGISYTTVGSATSTDIATGSEQNLRDVQIVNGQLYVSSQKSLVLGTVGTGTPTTAGRTDHAACPSTQPISGSGAPGANGYFLAHLNGAGTAPDTLYITDTVANSAAGQIDKYSLVSGSWVPSGSFSVGTDVTGLTGVVNGSDVNLHGHGQRQVPRTSGTLYSFTDTYRIQRIHVAGSADLAAARPARMKAFRGIAFAPTTAVAPNGLHAADVG